MVYDVVSIFRTSKDIGFLPSAKVRALVRVISSVFSQVVPHGRGLDSITFLRDTITQYACLLPVESSEALPKKVWVGQR
jgi:hypothetical protein